MRPPICALCGHDFRHEDDGGDLVRFRAAKSLPDGMVGHPRGVEWFCRRHLAAARELSGSSLAEAMTELRRKYRWRLGPRAWLRRLRRL